jgi:hypothetical protein
VTVREKGADDIIRTCEGENKTQLEETANYRYQFTAHQNYQDHGNEQDEMGGACGAQGGEKKRTQDYSRKTQQIS